MRIGVVTSLFPAPTRPFEGIFAERRWSGMVARGHQVCVVHALPHTPGPLARGAWAELRDMPAREERAGVTVRRPRYWHWPGRARGNARRFAHAASRALADFEPEVVVADYAWPAATAVDQWRASGIPFFVSGRGSDVLQVRGVDDLRDELARCLGLSSGWVGVSADLVRAMDDLAGRPGNGRLIPNGVDLERFTPGDRGIARERVSLDATACVTLVVGHLIERKDPGLAYAAFRAAAPEEGRLVFLGRGPLLDDLRADVERHGDSARVSLLGEVEPEELVWWYRAADCLLLTSSREGRPNVVLEALACGCPVVATAAGGTGELLADVPGALVASRDPEVIGARLRATLTAPPAADELRARVADLSWDASCEALEQYLVERKEAA